MTKAMFALVLLPICFSIATPVSSAAATVPAGTTLSARTLTAISSRDRVGRTFKAQLDQDVVVDGKVVLKAGTHVAGRIDSSPTDPRRTRPLTINLTAVSVNGAMVPIKTVSGFDVQPHGWTTARRGISVSGSEFVAPAGTKMQVKLAEPLQI
jgi:hypothetical protein